MVLSLEEVKLYLKVDGDEDNTLITDLIGAAEELCQDILRFPLTEFTEVPETVKQALLYAIGNLYELREAVDMKAFQAGALQSEVTTRIKIRYRTGLTTSMRVLYGCRVFQILSVIDKDERHRVIELMCKEVIPGGG